MKQYQYIFFDLDGTLTDPKVGITKSVAYALQYFGIHVEDLDSLCKFIGPPLKDSFMKYYGMDDEKAELAVEKCREYFKPHGVYENVVYEGVDNMLKRLKECGKTVVLATSKPTVFAEVILEHFELRQYLDFVIGSELDGTRVKKGDVIAYALEKARVTDKSQVVMVGDREHDIIGAKENGLDSIGVLYGYGDRAEHEKCGADVIVETVEELMEKLLSRKTPLYDSHIHSIHSHDSSQTLEELCNEAIEKGVKGIAITDHMNTRVFDEENTLQNIQEMILDVEHAREKYKDKLQVFCGIEISEMLDDYSRYEQMMALYDYDIVIGSAHYAGKDMLPCARVKFDGEDALQQADDYLKQYLMDVTQMIEGASFDVLAHLTYPLRYINGRYKLGIDWRKYEEQFRGILERIISKNIALEVNTAGYHDEDGWHSLPDAEILKLYYDMCGRLVTLGSDSHRNCRIAARFDEVIEMLRIIGFEYYCYYEKRRPIKVYI